MWTIPREQVTLSFNPTTDDQQTVLDAVARAYSAADRTETAPSASGRQPADEWTAASMRDYVAALDPGARMVLLAVVTSSPCPQNDVRHQTQLSERRYTQALRSLEDSLRAVPHLHRLPFDTDEDCFVVDDEVAELAARALDQIYGA
jgi:hypothetical protein